MKSFPAPVQNQIQGSRAGVLENTIFGWGNSSSLSSDIIKSNNLWTDLNYKMNKVGRFFLI